VTVVFNIFNHLVQFRHANGRFRSPVQYPHTTAIAHFGMWPPGHDLLHKLLCMDTELSTPADHSGRCPLHDSPVGTCHVFGLCGSDSFTGTPWVNGNPFVLMVDLYCGGSIAGTHYFSHQLIGYAVVVTFQLDVIINIYFAVFEVPVDLSSAR